MNEEKDNDEVSKSYSVVPWDLRRAITVWFGWRYKDGVSAYRNGMIPIQFLILTSIPDIYSTVDIGYNEHW